MGDRAKGRERADVRRQRLAGRSERPDVRSEGIEAGRENPGIRKGGDEVDGDLSGCWHRL